MSEEKFFLLKVNKLEDETDLAICVLDTRGKRVWFPKSKVSYNVNTKGKNEVTLRVPEWLAETKAFLEFEEE